MNVWVTPGEDSHLDLLPRGLTAGVVRASVHYYNTVDELDRAVGAGRGPHLILTRSSHPGSSLLAEGAQPEQRGAPMFTRKLIASTVAAATLATGGLAVAALNPLSTAGAEEQADARPAAAGAPDPRPAHLCNVLDELVADGTLTQAQADAVKPAA